MSRIFKLTTHYNGGNRIWSIDSQSQFNSNFELVLCGVSSVVLQRLGLLSPLPRVRDTSLHHGVTSQFDGRTKVRQDHVRQDHPL